MFKSYDYEKEYPCSPITSSKHFTKCMYLLIKLDKIEKLINRPRLEIFEEYVDSNPREIFETNEKGWTPLSIAARNSKRLNLFDCIPIILRVAKKHCSENNIPFLDYINQFFDFV